MVTNLYLVKQYAHDPTFIVDMTKLWHLTQCWLKGVNANASNRNAVRELILMILDEKEIVRIVVLHSGDFEKGDLELC